MTATTEPKELPDSIAHATAPEELFEALQSSPAGLAEDQAGGHAAPRLRWPDHEAAASWGRWSSR